MKKWIKHSMPKSAQTEAYRGYLIVPTSHGFSIQKDGYHLAYAQSIEAAKATINELT